MDHLLGGYNKRPVVADKPVPHTKLNKRALPVSIPPDESVIPDNCFHYQTNPPAFTREPKIAADRYMMELLEDLVRVAKERKADFPADDPRGMVLEYRRWILAHLTSSTDRRLDLENFERMVRGWSNWDDENGPEDLDNAVQKCIRDLGIIL